MASPSGSGVPAPVHTETISNAHVGAEDGSGSAPEVSNILAAVRTAGNSCIRIFIAGAVTHVGKTTICLSILAALRKAGFQAHELAYIKPATQCEAPDLLAKWCTMEGIEHVSGQNAPLVFYQGFTRSFLAGEQGTSAQWMEKITARVDELAKGRRVIVVDGVGFPAVGSIVGVDNADVAKAARAPVLLVCKSGVGAAVDSFSLNASYFLAKRVPVLGAVFNLGDLDGFNAWQLCAENIELWFSQRDGGRERYYGVVPLAPALDGLRERIPKTEDAELREMAALNASHVAAHADLAAILADAAADPWCRCSGGLGRTAVPVPAAAPAAKPASREAVQKAAVAAGSKGGG